ncbi:MAG TPA: M20/M25/M40 family metallo-hydrolase [Bacteroidaceae bacterium]|mgnify:CR=1 FL=1|nr:M20/M25/M40 family metallo-hydrolase [Bacteroidaceae bacterium]
MINKNQYIDLFVKLLSIPALSGEESRRADLLEKYFLDLDIPVQRIHNNLIAGDPDAGDKRKTLLLNSHLDTVPPSDDWLLDPYIPIVNGTKITGLGSNDAGASVIALIHAFEILRDKVEDAVRLLLVLSAEEEISGQKGISSIVGQLGHIDGVLIGEPTNMQVAVAERGLMVIDAVVKGRSGHAGRNEGDNAIYKAISDISAIGKLKFERRSEWLPDPSVQVTLIESGKRHNVVPDSCNYTMDVRSNDQYSNQELLDILNQTCQASLSPRSMRLKSSSLPEGHFFYQAIQQTGLVPFGSLTLSDMAVLPFPAVKMGPGHSSRSHSANEYVLIREIENGADVYTRFIQSVYNILKPQADETMG